MSKIILSIIIAAYNSEKYFEECLQSIQDQQLDEVEFILIDGASSDSTMQIANRYRHLFSHVISEPDQGQSDAFNKGFALANGDYLTWLNSDDVLLPNVLSKVLDTIKRVKKDWFVANTIFIDENNKILRCCRSGGFERAAVRDGLLNVFGPSTFFSKKLYKKIGTIDESYHYCMDTEYWWRIVRSGQEYCRINLYFWGLRMHSEAKTANVILTGEVSDAMAREQKRISQKHFGEITPLVRKKRIFLTRVSRILKGPYLIALWDTFRFKKIDYKNFKAYQF
jgi:glycosyltransferase involved in cell wall biosynthesis